MRCGACGMNHWWKFCKVVGVIYFEVAPFFRKGWLSSSSRLFFLLCAGSGGLLYRSGQYLNLCSSEWHIKHMWSYPQVDEVHTRWFQLLHVHIGAVSHEDDPA